MKQSTLAFICAALLIIILAVSWCGRNPQPPTAVSRTPSQIPSPTLSATALASPNASAATAQTSSTPIATLSPSETPSAEFRKVATKVGPAVILITVFDPSGQLLRTGTGFFVSRDGRLATDLHTIDGAAYAVAKSPDGKIRNVTGILVSSTALDLALLKAETQIGVPFLPLSRVARPENGTTIAVVGSQLARRKFPLTVATISGQTSESGGEALPISTPLSSDAEGSPVVDENGEVIGVVTSAHAEGAAVASVVRPVSVLHSLLAQTKAGATGHWAVGETASPTPTATPSVETRRLRVLYNPAPKYPSEARFSGSPPRGSGRYRVIFNTAGQVKEVQTLQSTGRPVLDQAAVTALHQWKAEPGREWSVLVPITFEP